MNELSLNPNQDNLIIQVTKAIASNTRLRILKLLANEELDISRLAEALGQTEANVSAQVKKLEEAQLVESRYEPGDHGVRKICTTSVFKISVQIVDQ